MAAAARPAGPGGFQRPVRSSSPIAMGGTKQPSGGWSRQQWTAMLVMYPSYMSALFSRAAMDASLPAMLTDAVLSCTPADSAALLSMGVAFYSVGKLLGGTLSDYMGAARTFSATTLNSGLMMVLVSVSPSMRVMQVWWGVSRLGGACYWPAMIKVTSSWWDEDSFGEAWSILTVRCCFRQSAIPRRVCKAFERVSHDYIYIFLIYVYIVTIRFLYYASM